MLLAARPGALPGALLAALLAAPLPALPALPALQPPAAPDGAPPPVYDGRAGQLAVDPPRLEGAIDVDGRLDEPVWRRAAVLTGFSLYYPVDRQPAPDSTEVRVWYSADAIHFGVRAFEPHGAVRATLAERDRVEADDNVEIHLDTFDERRRALVFIVNPLGVQADGTKSEGGGFIPGANVAPGDNDLSADFRWQSKGRVTAWGYEVELRIPFASLRYPGGAPQRWGLQVVRHVRHSGYELTWTPARRGSASFIAQAGRLVGLAGMRHGHVLELNPELTSTLVGSPDPGPPAGGPGEATGWRYANDVQLGGNVRWGLGSNFVLNGTVRPDFSQVEADATQIAADQRFALFYPERRPFFVEGSDQFNVPNTLVYTRRIVRPEAAAKLTGKVGRTDVAVLTAADDPATTPDGSRPVVGIARLRRDVGEQSTAGLLYSARAGGGRTNHVAGADARLVFGGLYFAQLQAVGSVTSTGGATRSAPMWEAVLDRTGRHWGFHYNVLGIGDGFAADNGFVPRTGFVQPNVSNRFTAYGRPGALFERYNVFATVEGLWRYDDFFAGRSVLESRASASNELTFRGGWEIEVSPAVARYAFDPGDYAALRTPDPAGGPPRPFVPTGRVTAPSLGLGVSTPQFRRFSASVEGTLGDDVDFLEAVRVRRRDLDVALELRPNERLRATLTYLSSSFTRRRDGERTLSTRIPRLRVEYQLARPVFVRVVSQYESARRAPLRDPGTGEVLLVPGEGGAVAPSVEQRSNALRTDWLFSYRPGPGTVFFVGYGNTLTEPDALAFRGLRRTDDGVFVKASYLFRVR